MVDTVLHCKKYHKSTVINFIRITLSTGIGNFALTKANAHGIDSYCIRPTESNKSDTHEFLQNMRISSSNAPTTFYKRNPLNFNRKKLVAFYLRAHSVSILIKRTIYFSIYKTSLVRGKKMRHAIKNRSAIITFTLHIVCYQVLASHEEG